MTNTFSDVTATYPYENVGPRALDSIKALIAIFWSVSLTEDEHQQSVGGL